MSALTDPVGNLVVGINTPQQYRKLVNANSKEHEWLGRKVDLVTKAALKPHIGRRILSEVAML